MFWFIAQWSSSGNGNFTGGHLIPQLPYIATLLSTPKVNCTLQTFIWPGVLAQRSSCKSRTILLRHWKQCSQSFSPHIHVGSDVITTEGAGNCTEVFITNSSQEHVQTPGSADMTRYLYHQSGAFDETRGSQLNAMQVTQKATKYTSCFHTVVSWEAWGEGRKVGGGGGGGDELVRTSQKTSLKNCFVNVII